MINGGDVVTRRLFLFFDDSNKFPLVELYGRFMTMVLTLKWAHSIICQG